jgi:hypothetical protein
MRHSRLVRLAGSLVLMAALMVPSAAMASSAAPAGDAQAAPATSTVAPIKLSCTLVLQNVLGPAKAVRANVCTWEAPAGVDVKTYRLWRIKNAPNPTSRTLIATIAAGQTLRYGDRAIRAGHTYTYVVAGIDAAGKRVALSNRVKISVGRAIQTLRMACAYSVDRNGVACNWSRTTRPAATRYVLLRSVDGAARERIYSTWMRGRRSFLDTDVKPGQTVRYAVLAVTRTGRVVAKGGPIVVSVPDATAASR